MLAQRELLIFLSVFILRERERERERERAQEEEGQRERESEDSKQAPNCQHRAQLGAQTHEL